ncbi:MAG: hypothetical protein QNJ16_01585 [Rhodobacter sp.]|nr:hypothetical protein [Rhodobacter sp.]
MLLDDKTELIAHFIGLFGLNTEAARLRVEYNQFLAERAATADLGGLLNVTVNVSSPYALGDYYPFLPGPYSALTLPPASGAASWPFLFSSPWSPLPGGPGHFGAPAFQAPTFAAMPEFYFIVPPPSSMATITVQLNSLSDQDHLWDFDPGFPFFDPASFDGLLVSLVSAADALDPLGFPAYPEDEDAMVDTGLDIAHAIKGLKETGLGPSVEGADIHLAFDADASEVTVNGQTAGELPRLSDHSEAFAPSDPDADAAGPSGVLDGDAPVHNVVAGDNVLINEAHLITDWIDAPVIAVLGGVYFANAISQINVWHNLDAVNGGRLFAHSTVDEAVSAASISTVANAKPVPSGEALGAPAHVAVTRIEGNVVNYNHIQQFNFANDADVVSVSFEGSETFIEAGGNLMSNFASLLGLGFHYDLIIVGGSIIDVSFLSQTNVLLDNDNVHFGEAFGGVLETSGNLLFNSASITDIGVDTTVEMTAAYSEAAETAAKGGDDFSDAILSDAAFAGTGVMSVLYISGNLIDIQLVEQTNVLGDADQVAVAARTVQGADGATIQVTTGGNELINVASVTDAGVDSTIYSAGGTYSDAVLYQAEFIAADDPLAIQNTSDLASEAVLFLADGILGDDPAAAEYAIAPPAVTETPADSMETVLA